MQIIPKFLLLLLELKEKITGVISSTKFIVFSAKYGGFAYIYTGNSIEAYTNIQGVFDTNKASKLFGQTA